MSYAGKSNDTKQGQGCVCTLVVLEHYLLGTVECPALRRGDPYKRSKWICCQQNLGFFPSTWREVPCNDTKEKKVCLYV